MNRRNIFDVRTPLFRPLWIRCVVILVVLGWTYVEVSRGSLIWAAVFGASGLYLVWALLITWDNAAFDDDGQDNGSD